MKVRESTKGFPPEFAILTPLMDEVEQERLSEKEEQFSINDSLVKV